VRIVSHNRLHCASYNFCLLHKLLLLRVNSYAVSDILYLIRKDQNICK